MTPVNFRAIYLPDKNGFQVEVSRPGSRQIELMSEERFKQFIADLDTKIEIGGLKVEFDGGDPVAPDAVKDYFRKVYRSWQQAKRQKRI